MGRDSEIRREINSLSVIKFCSVLYQIACCQVEGQGAHNFCTEYYKLLNAIGDIICEKTCHKVLFCVANTFL